MRKRFGRLRRDVVNFIATLDALGLGDRPKPVFMEEGGGAYGDRGGTMAVGADSGRVQAVVVNVQPREFEFRTDAGKLTAFSEWFQQQVQADILSVPAGTDPTKPWTAKYVDSAYKRGQLNAYLSTKEAKLLASEGIGQQSAESFLRSSFGSPETVSKVQLLATRSFEALKGVTASMGSDMNRILAQGIADGTGPRVVAKEMAARIDTLTRSRALLIARTETIHAHAEGQLDAFDQLDVKELDIKAEWSTAGDDRVCPECQALEGTIMTVEEARGLIPVHPNCRCSWIPADESGKKKEGGEAAPASVIPTVPKAYEDKRQKFQESLMEQAGFPSRGPARAEFIAGAQAKLEKEISEARVWSRARPATVEKIIRDGRIKTQFETQKSGGFLDNGVRSKFEQDFFGIPTNIDPASRPVYGYLSKDADGDIGKKGTLDQYGMAAIKFKPEVHSRTTFNRGDSLDTTGRAQFEFVSPRPLNAPDVAAVDVYNWKNPEIKNGFEFWEAQVHGGTKASDIESIVFGVTPSKSLQSLLKKENIPWSIKA
jgi:SPP1 gp7 family putative phage head morphogenesis protein